MNEPLSHPHRSVFQREMERIRGATLILGDMVDAAIVHAVEALVNRDVLASTRIIAGDARINELQREVRELCFNIILTQGPVASDLREVIGYLHMSAELERMGDHCVSIAKIARNLVDFPEVKPYLDVPKMAEFCAEQVRDILGAMVGRDDERARAVAQRDDRIDRIYHRIFDDLIELMIQDSSTVYRATNLIFIAHHLERIADRVTNLAEDLVFLDTGEIVELG
jgi:phosphate transport system protein